jgi:hypothetical protein
MEQIFNEWVAIVASLATILSLVINLFQWRKNVSLLKILRARSEGAFNIYRNIAYQTNLMFRKSDTEHYKNCANKISGAAQAARQEIMAFCKHQLNGFVPQEENLKGETLEQSN